MTYVSTGLIQATDYNGFVSTTVAGNINATWGTAYGQTALSTVSAQGVVSATNWATLNNTLSAIGVHQGTTLTSRTSPVATNTITILSNLGTDISSVYTNLLNSSASGSQVVNWTGTASQTGSTGNFRSAWAITFTDTVTFPNSTAATNFFNMGGLFKIQFSKSSTGTNADPEWNNFVNNVCGVVYFTSDAASKTINGVTYLGTKVVGGSGTPTVATNLGFNQLTSSAQQIFRQTDTTYNYTGDYVAVTAAYSAPTLTFVTTWYSAARTTSAPNRWISGGTAIAAGTTSPGTAPSTIVTYFPPGATSGFTNTWGTPTVASTVSATPYA